MYPIEFRTHNGHGEDRKDYTEILTVTQPKMKPTERVIHSGIFPYALTAIILYMSERNSAFQNDTAHPPDISTK